MHISMVVSVLANAWSARTHNIIRANWLMPTFYLMPGKQLYPRFTLQTMLECMVGSLFVLRFSWARSTVLSTAMA